ncbi:motility associated factor glycosyltransferase family protein [Pseudomonas chlororaphis]|uniref:Glutamate synthase [NADPH] large chain n=1 Tax=Pseudomonas chlororaphis subsp. aureofaciens TaxID=587851 RepID=A0AAD0ZG58_9PSED|nr:6-hydroxymethylpterin diphosphokinase MptE-like protein [Pseudomonas chlororaphis]AIC18777.1 motility accesory factor Maf-2 [Pseudomonas chlororaphis]AZE22099.1 Glutamate synthase [NADPH] large chain [Pseudomonas chlororaphis subsp. aureofaciens]AZE28453.1 Glutamate synthase [NADPH] large chain [Pseudomonas chlororaphis subsp. aureofaciens]AZE41032.1 Glutamate synthase [NADPH] large chain [Pseudomonas chlororaphis subsp. aureofaciens]QHC88307.1 motility accessory factor Maf-2 [Pseudomonas c
MSESFEGNAQAIQARWPRLLERLLAEDSAGLQADLVEGLGSTLSISGIQLTSRHDRTAEARTQAASLPADSPVIHLYGTGLGDLQQILLENPALQRLQVHILNGAVFALVLQLLDQQAWLNDPRVELGYAGDLAEIQLPFFALPSELVLADDYNAKIRDRLVSEVHLAFNNRDFVADSPEVTQRLQSSAELVASDSDVAQLFGTQPGREVFVIATGPSLERHFERLREIRAQARRPLFICVDTAYRPLLKQGIEPDIVVSIDHRISGLHLPPEKSAAITLVYLPMVDPQILALWQGPRYVGYSASPIYARMREQLPKAQLYVGGSVIHPALDLAVKMGAEQVTLFGADFAFPMNKTHAGWLDGELGPQLGAARHWVLDGHGQRVRTQLNFRSYLCELERFIAGHPRVRFYNSSRDGAMIAGTIYHPEFSQ